MNVISQVLQRLTVASVLASGLLSVALPASAQASAEPAMTMKETAPSAVTSSPNTAAPMTMDMRTTNVSASTVDALSERKVQMEQAEARRMLFRNQGTSL